MINLTQNEPEFFHKMTDDDLLVYLNSYHKDTLGFRMEYQELNSLRGNRVEILRNIYALEKVID